MFGRGSNHYTTTQDVCGGKEYQYCQMPVSSVPASSVTSLIMDNRSDAGNLYIGTFTAADQVHGVYSGFMSNPDGSRNPFYGAASFESDKSSKLGTPWIVVVLLGKVHMTRI